MKHTLITGGAGFIGSHLADFLVAGGDRVSALDNLSTGSLDNLRHLEASAGFAFRRGSVLDPGLLDEMVARADRVFHLAAAVGVELIVRDPTHVIESNVRGTEHVLEACARHGKPVLLASSSEVYGKSAALPFREDGDLVLGATTRSRWSYACSKAVGEFLGQAYGHGQGLPVVTVRLFNTTGPRQTGQYGMVLPRFVRQALAGQPVTVYGDGRQSRCFCHVADVVGGLVDLMEEPRARGEVVNLGNDTSITIRALAEKVCTAAQSDAPIVHVPFEEAYASGFEDMAARTPDLGKARDLVGYQPRRELDHIIEDLIAHERAR